MCGRFGLELPAKTIAEYFLAHNLRDVTPRYNIAPTQEVLAIFRDVEMPETNQAGSFTWGLVPFWADTVEIGAKMTNARAETLRQKPSFRAAFKYRRCLIPVSGFYEWKRVGKVKQPWYFRPLEDGVPFAFAGLWEHWSGSAGEALWSCTIITTEANARMAEVHHRMPVILSPDSFDQWLDPNRQDSKQLEPLLVPCPPDLMTAYPVSTYVNKSGREGPRCIEPLTASEPNGPAEQPGLFD